MISEPVEIRTATIADADTICEIYAFHVLNGTATFDYVPPANAEWQAKIGAILSKDWPFLVASIGEEIVGYAYATQFRDRPAYAHTCENSIYVAYDKRGLRIGSQLLTSLLMAAGGCGFQQMIAVIGGGEPSSIALHRSCGFEHAGCMRSVGFKFGKHLDTVYMQRALNERAKIGEVNTDG